MFLKAERLATFVIDQMIFQYLCLCKNYANALALRVFINNKIYYRQLA